MSITQELINVIRAINAHLKATKKKCVTVQEALSVLSKKGIHFEEKYFRHQLHQDWHGIINAKQSGEKGGDYLIYEKNLSARTKSKSSN